MLVKTLTPILDDEDERFFQWLLEIYPRREAREAARWAFLDLMRKCDNRGQTLVLLLEGAQRYEREVRARGSSNFMRLGAFIESKVWSAENFPANQLRRGRLSGTRTARAADPVGSSAAEASGPYGRLWRGLGGSCDRISRVCYARYESSVTKNKFAGIDSAAGCAWMTVVRSGGA